MRRNTSLALAALFAASASPAGAEMLLWGIQVEQAEYRIGDGGFGGGIAAWDLDAFVGSDELKAVWRSEGEYALEHGAFETLENQLRLQMPVSDFFDAVVGVRLDAPEGETRVHGVIGLHGLTRQWFEIDADLFLSEHPAVRLEVEYEALITNRLILVPSIEFELPFTDDEAMGQGAFGPTLEVGARLGYDLVDRLVSPYVGVHYERAFGASADLARADGEDAGSVRFVMGARMLF